MIWVWIIFAVAISVWLCRGSGLKYYHYVWLLLPIEMYGISVAGAMLKPYMIFGLLIIVLESKKQRIHVPACIVVVAVLLIMTDCLNGWYRDSIMQHLMYIFVTLIAIYYMRASEYMIDLKIISRLTRSLVLGYGCVFAVAFIVYSINPMFPDMLASNRVSAGLFLQQYGAGGSVSIRFRGFTIDPNAVIIPMFPGYCFALFELYTSRKEKMKNVLAMVAHWLIVMISGSRGAMLCSLIVTVFISVNGFISAWDKAKWIVSIICVIMILCITVVVADVNPFITLGDVFDNFLNQRAGLTDEAGRLTIWKRNLSTLFDSGNWAFGVGQNRIQYHTIEGKSCHNTWVEWICGTGIFVGTGIVLWYLLTPILRYRRLRRAGCNEQLILLLLSYYTLVICVAFVDNITNATMIFLFFILTLCTNVGIKDPPNTV